jgi:hypothetical protein
MLPLAIGIPEKKLPAFNLLWSRPEALHLKLGKLNARVANVPNRLRTFLAVGRPIKDINEYFDLITGTRIGIRIRANRSKIWVLTRYYNGHVEACQPFQLI